MQNLDWILVQTNECEQMFILLAFYIAASIWFCWDILINIRKYI